MATTTKKKEEYPNTLAGAYGYQPQGAGSQEGIKQLSEYKNLVNQKTSALSSLGQANKQALKYADTQALAQGYATQGAALQNVGNLQNAYMNQVGGINQQYQQQLGALQDTTSTNALTEYQDRLAQVTANTSLSSEQLANEIKTLKDAFYTKMNASDIEKAQLDTQTVTGNVQQTIDNQSVGNLYGIDTSTEGVTSLEAIKNAQKGTYAENIFGKNSGKETAIIGLKYLINNNMLTNGDTIKMGKNVFVLTNGQFYKVDKKVKAKYNAEDYYAKGWYKETYGKEMEELINNK